MIFTHYHYPQTLDCFSILFNLVNLTNAKSYGLEVF